MPAPKAPVANSGADMSVNAIGMNNKENYQVRALGSGLRELMQAKNKSAA